MRGPRCRYPGAVRDPDTGAWISDAEVAEIPYTAFASTPDAITARLVVRRVKDARYRDALFPVWRYHRVHKRLTASEMKFRRNPPLCRRDGEEMPLAGHTLQLVSAAVLELES